MDLCGPTHVEVIRGLGEKRAGSLPQRTNCQKPSKLQMVHGLRMVERQTEQHHGLWALRNGQATIFCGCKQFPLGHDPTACSSGMIKMQGAGGEPLSTPGHVFCLKSKLSFCAKITPFSRLQNFQLSKGVIEHQIS